MLEVAHSGKAWFLSFLMGVCVCEREILTISQLTQKFLLLKDPNQIDDNICMRTCIQCSKLVFQLMKTIFLPGTETGETLSCKPAPSLLSFSLAPSLLLDVSGLLSILDILFSLLGLFLLLPYEISIDPKSLSLDFTFFVYLLLSRQVVGEETCLSSSYMVAYLDISLSSIS